MRYLIAVLSILVAAAFVSPLQSRLESTTKLCSRPNPWINKGDVLWRYRSQSENLSVKLVSCDRVQLSQNCQPRTKLIPKSFSMKIVEISHPHTIFVSVPAEQKINCYHVVLVDGFGHEFQEFIELPTKLLYRNQRINILSPDLPSEIPLTPPPPRRFFLFNM